MNIENTVAGIGKAAQLLGWSKDTLRYWTNKGVLPPEAVEFTPGGHRRYRVGIIKKWARVRAQCKVIPSDHKETIE